MTDFLLDNLGTIIVSIILFIGVGLIIFRMIKDRKKGCSSCSCGCSTCPSSGICHKENKQ